MKKTIFFLSVLLTISGISYADTHIPAGDVNGNWDFSNSPYIINGEINIQVDDELTIEPGVQVLFSGHYKFNIYGRLLAEGTAVDTISFTAQDTTAGWHSLRFWDTNTNGQDSSKVVYCKLEYGRATGSSDNRKGGAIYCENSSDILLKNCLITNNYAYWGGGIYYYNSSPYLINVTITDNSAIGTYGDGGGILCYNSSPSLTNVTINENSADDYGGGICCEWESSPSLTNVAISENTANGSGGGICSGYSSPILKNVTITGNSATGIWSSGGGILFSQSSPILENVTISGNTAFSGGGIKFLIDSNPSFDSENRCNIFLNYASIGNDLLAYDCPIIDVIVDTFTIMQPDYDDYFAYPIDNFTFDIHNTKVEQVNQDLYVSPFGFNNNSGLSEDNPLLTISYALAKIIPDSTNPNIIHLANGIYSPSQTGENYSINCRSYVSLRGEDDDSTVLDGDGLSNILSCYYDNNFTIENVTITNGSDIYGGGIYCYHSSPSLTNVTIAGNIADNYGGGIYCSNSSPSLTNVTIAGNIADYYGGGIYCSNSSPILVNCILWNDSPQEIYISSGSVIVTYSDILGGWPDTTNIDSDPLFVDPDNADFHLTENSPCIDTGDPTSPLDPDGTRSDMGAYYFHQSGGLNPPENVTIYIESDTVFIYWNIVVGATEYKVYSDSNPYGDFSTLEWSGSATSWNESIGINEKKFYYVTAGN